MGHTARRSTSLVAGAVGVLALLPAVGACGSPGPAGEQGTRDRPAGQSESTGPRAGALPLGDEPVDLDPARFTTRIDHPYWPMEPGSRWTYRETDADGSELRVVVTVSTETREVANGVTARVVRDTVTRDGELVEDTVDWYAQDDAGTLWYLGENTAEFEDGRITSTSGSFEAGVDGALAGVMLPADPTPGQEYRQEFYAGEAEDNGAVLSVDEQAEVPFGHFTGALLTKDTITIEPDVLEYKLYAPGVGPVLVVGVSGGGGQEELVAFEDVGDDVARAAGTTPLGESYGAQPQTGAVASVPG